MSTSVFNLWYNHASSSAGMRPHIGCVVRQKPGSPSRQLDRPRQSVGVHHPNSRAHTKVWDSMVKMSKKKCEKGWKWVKVGENTKMLYPPCGRSIKTYARGNNDAPSITKYGSPLRLDTQIVALRPHCTRTALRAPSEYPTLRNSGNTYDPFKCALCIGPPAKEDPCSLWALAKVAEYPTLQHSDITSDPLR